MIELTPKAVDKIKEIAQEENIKDLCIRVKIIGGGCAGFSYDLFFEEYNNITNFDETFDYNGVKVCVDPLSYQYLDESDIDYISNSMGGGFKFTNPNITSTCGCGSSVSF